MDIEIRQYITFRIGNPDRYVVDSRGKRHEIGDPEAFAGCLIAEWDEVYVSRDDVDDLLRAEGLRTEPDDDAMWPIDLEPVNGNVRYRCSLVLGLTEDGRAVINRLESRKQ